MAIEKIVIRNCKSLKNVSLELTEINCLIGENGTGKTNIIKCLDYFYSNLTDSNLDENLFDKNNPYNNFLEISITYNLSKLMRIAENGYLRSEAVNNFFKKLLFDVKKYLDISNKVTITLKQNKKNRIVWSHSYDFREILKNIYPIYVVQARQINLVDWEHLWEIIGDMGKLKEKDDILSNDLLSELFEKIYGNRYKKNLDYLSKELKDSDIKVNKFNMTSRFSHIYQLQMSGKQFSYKDKNLDYFSDGMNSNNYLKILFNLIEKLSNTKLKEPIIIVDEPEIGLHPRLVDDLITTIINKSGVVRTIIATHSSRMVKKIINNNTGSLFHISLSNGYTNVRKMRSFTDKRETNIVTEKEASFYFSRGIFFVEGPTELELFTHPLLLEVFPVLREVEVFAFNSNNVGLNIVHPKRRNTAIPYLLALDLDKIVKYNNNHFTFSGDNFNPLKNEEIKEREVLFYGRKRIKTLQVRKRINGISKKCKFIPDENWNFINDNLFHDFVNLIKQYCLEYNVYPCATTIEGAVININNSNIIYEWLKTYKNIDGLDKLYLFKELPMYRATVLRLLFNGKFDTLEEIKQDLVTEIEDHEVKEIYEVIKSNKTGKTDGWVTELINHYFLKHLELSFSDIYSPEVRENFAFHFPEIYDIIESLEKILIE
ncbi:MULTISPECIES: retron Eco8 family effector endonuclease [unclassified Mesobacillus]|uniref:retron Eco8 family effector endonuclease n=1 Tax=unclassified Mesobacillus TaxID=2675270 RepID=UPI00203DBEAF|nr:MULTISPECIES: retron Eco8 family effector endonuclease [unclassified Mesobacillus]MCM3124433.1 retron Eco8 family effector endonuclease [Mesobacillus sp. MER 33]MCM3234857.1 retron Eco8 family effector endonuclease [Mesobacillus sp. MER 48]